MRCSELLSYIRKSKCGPFCQGCTLTITAWPFVALDRYLAMTTVAPGHGPFHFANDTHPTRVRLNQLIRTLVTQREVPPSRFSSHSYRIGTAYQTGESRPWAGGLAIAI